jgi:hypothetical protein
MCLNTITTYTTCACRSTSVQNCDTYKEMVAEAERHCRHRHPWIHESDDESYASVIAHTKCPLYYEEKEEKQGSCVFCQVTKPNGGVKMTKFLDEMEKMLAK